MTTRFKILVMLGLCLSLTLGACGRKGSLDDPSAPTPPASSAAADPAAPVLIEEPIQPRSDSSDTKFSTAI
jgi:predicted small lipoprotein YifL